MGNYYYVTAATGENFISEYARYSILSLLKAGVDPQDVYVIGNNKKDLIYFKKYFSKINNISMIQEDLSKVAWKMASGKRKYSLFKSAALYKTFKKPKSDKYMIYFDGDVLWYKNPSSFFDQKCKKTWFHHGKDLSKRCPVPKKEIDIKSIKSLSQWCSLPMAHLMIKYGFDHLPEREVVAGLYLLHPRDHAAVLKLTYKGCLENSDKFIRHEGCGDQKPMNAALSVLNIDWHGGSRFFCPEHVEYFNHFFGKKDMKKKFHEGCRKIGIR